MGEEPGRLRALAIIAREAMHPSPDQVAGLAAVNALLAEVERLAGERDKAYRATGEYALRAKKAEAECERLAGRVAALETALRAIASNAEAWHGPVNDDNRHARALVVIARWANDPSSIPAGIAALHVGGSE